MSGRRRTASRATPPFPLLTGAQHGLLVLAALCAAGDVAVHLSSAHVSLLLDLWAAAMLLGMLGVSYALRVLRNGFRLKARIGRDRPAFPAIVPICAECKKIRDDNGRWHRVEDFISSRTGAIFTHGICPTCAKKYDPDPPRGPTGRP